jgi:hypothetical protein
MGRYVSGDFEYKFAFGDQDSTFGEVLQECCTGTQSYCSRFVGTNGEGERVELYVHNWKELKKSIQKFIGKNFKQKSEKDIEKWCKLEEVFGNEYWNKVMMKRFIKEDLGDEEYYYYNVEY